MRGFISHKKNNKQNLEFLARVGTIVDQEKVVKKVRVVHNIESQ